MQDAAILSAARYPDGRFTGQGIVIVAGGPRYYTCAWVCITLLRRVLGCTLPIQVWYLGPDEMSREMIDLLHPFDVACVDALAVRQRYPARRLGGWECKPYAIAHSPFKEVLYLDADTIALADPSFLFSTAAYRKTGTIFWPDVGRLANNAAIWEICRVPYRDEPEFESGQIVIDKERCWAALQLTLHLNDFSDFYYQYIQGDKETFHMAWRMLGQPYGMPAYAPLLRTGFTSPHDRCHGSVLEQHDFTGRVIFQHRTMAKWIAWGENLRVSEFQYEDTCLESLQELRRHWHGWVGERPVPAADAGNSVADISRVRYFLYCRIGADQRVLELLPTYRIGKGSGPDERAWHLEEDWGHRVLVIEGKEGMTCVLTHHADGIWRGYWLHYEQMPIELIPWGQEAFGRNPDPGWVRPWLASSI